MLSHLSLIILLITAGVYWSCAQAVKERALAAVKKRCLEMDVQMLDDYVALNSLALKRDGAGKIRILRTFLFEFSATGAERYNGQITLLGRNVETIHMEPYRIE